MRLDWFTVHDFTEGYNISKSTLYRQARDGKLRLTKIGRATRISKADAEAWANSLPTTKNEVN